MKAAETSEVRIWLPRAGGREPAGAGEDGLLGRVGQGEEGRDLLVYLVAAGGAEDDH